MKEAYYKKVITDYETILSALKVSLFSITAISSVIWLVYLSGYLLFAKLKKKSCSSKNRKSREATLDAIELNCDIVAKKRAIELLISSLTLLFSLIAIFNQLLAKEAIKIDGWPYRTYRHNINCTQNQFPFVRAYEVFPTTSLKALEDTLLLLDLSIVTILIAFLAKAYDAKYITYNNKYKYTIPFIIVKCGFLLVIGFIPHTFIIEMALAPLLMLIECILLGRKLRQLSRRFLFQYQDAWSMYGNSQIYRKFKLKRLQVNLLSTTSMINLLCYLLYVSVRNINNAFQLILGQQCWINKLYFHNSEFDFGVELQLKELYYYQMLFYWLELPPLSISLLLTSSTVICYSIITAYKHMSRTAKIKLQHAKSKELRTKLLNK